VRFAGCRCGNRQQRHQPVEDLGVEAPLLGVSGIADFLALHVPDNTRGQLAQPTAVGEWVMNPSNRVETGWNPEADAGGLSQAANDPLCARVVLSRNQPLEREM